MVWLSDSATTCSPAASVRPKNTELNAMPEMSAAFALAVTLPVPRAWMSGYWPWPNRSLPVAAKSSENSFALPMFTGVWLAMSLRCTNSAPGPKAGSMAVSLGNENPDRHDDFRVFVEVAGVEHDLALDPGPLRPAAERAGAEGRVVRGERLVEPLHQGVEEGAGVIVRPDPLIDPG